MMANPNFNIRMASDKDGQAVADLIHSIQVDEFAVPISLGDQPDLGNIEATYISKGGAFYVAEVDGRVIGSIGLDNLGDGDAALRKLYVAKEFRGKELSLAHELLMSVIKHAAKMNAEHMYLGVAEEFASARRFYEKTGFDLIDEGALPASFPKTPVDKYFYRLSLRG